jgi:hypothetical protein
MELDGQDLRAQAWQDRHEALRHLLAIGDTERDIQLSEHVDVVDGATLFQNACAMGARTHRRQASRASVSLRALKALDQDQEPQRTGRDEGDRGIDAWTLRPICTRSIDTKTSCGRGALKPLRTIPH